MARITVEDCLENIENRFELVLSASERARQLEMGVSEATLPWENDKPTVVALREIAQGTINPATIGQKRAIVIEETISLGLTVDEDRR